MPSRPSALPRALLWAALAVYSLYAGLRVATGPGRDTLTFRELTWTGGAVAQAVALTLVLAALYGRAAYMTYRREVAPPPGALVLPGARLNLFGEVFLALVGGVLLMVGTYLVLRTPEALLAGAHPSYRHYASASLPGLLAPALFFIGIGFTLMVLRRYVWEIRRGAPVRRYWSRAFARARTVERVELYWSHYHVKRGYARVPAAHWLRAKDPTSAGFFRDADLAIVPLDTPPDQLAALAGSWRARLDEAAGRPIATAPAAP